METNNDYASLESQKRNAQSQYNSTKDRIEEYEHNISRLKTVKAALAEQKESFRSIMTKDIVLFLPIGRRWKGQTYQDFKTKGSDLIDEDNAYYITALDAALDAVNLEITRLQNKIYNEYGVLGRLASLINNLTTAIENCFN